MRSPSTVGRRDARYAFTASSAFAAMSAGTGVRPSSRRSMPTRTDVGPVASSMKSSRTGPAAGQPQALASTIAPAVACPSWKFTATSRMVAESCESVRVARITASGISASSADSPASRCFEESVSLASGDVWTGLCSCSKAA